MKYIFYIIGSIIFFISCDRRITEIDEPNPNNGMKGVNSYVYKNKYTVPEINFYRGGENPAREIITQAEAQKYILPSFDIFNLDEVKIDFDKMKLYEIKGTTNTEYDIVITNDSLFYIENNGKTFNGIVKLDNSQYLYYKTYYYHRFQSESMKLESSGSVSGVLGYEDIFNKDNLLFGGKEYGFASPADMKNKNDIVCWVVVRFTLEKK